MRDVYGCAVRTFGELSQLRVAQEELAELIVAISHYLRSREDSCAHLIEELADVEIMCEQLRRIVGTKNLDPVKALKLERLEERIRQHDDTTPRQPGCQCQWEIGDSPCQVHGEDEEYDEAGGSIPPPGPEAWEVPGKQICQRCTHWEIQQLPDRIRPFCRMFQTDMEYDHNCPAWELRACFKVGKP